MKKRHPYRSQKQMTYHGRTGYPVIHATGTGREYIMVRKKGGGTKRLYLVNGNVPVKLRQKRGKGRPKK